MVEIKFSSDTTEVTKEITRLEQTLSRKLNSAFTEIEANADGSLKAINQNIKSSEKETLKLTTSFNNVTSSITNLNQKTDDLNEKTSSTNKVFNLLNSTTGAVTAALVSGASAYLLIESKFFDITKAVDTLNKSFSAVGVGSEKVANIFNGLGTSSKSFFSTVIASNRNLVGLAENLGSVSLAMAGLAFVLKDVENGFVKTARQIIIFVSIITGTLSASLALLISQFGRLAQKIGTELVDVNQKSADSFIKFEKSNFVLTRSIKNLNLAFDNLIGDGDEFLKFIDDLSTKTRILPSELQKAANEIISVGAPLGLTRDQIFKLTEAIADYAKITGKDAFDTSVNFLSALNGNSQAVLNYGIKLQEANLKQFALNEGIKKNFDLLTPQEKVQLRYNDLIKQYSINAKGAAAAIGSTLLGSQESLEVSTNNLAIAFGKGTAQIENLSLFALILDRSLRIIPDSIVSIAGVLSALAGRVLQVGGAFLRFSFEILAVVKVVKLLNFLLSRDLTQALLAAPIPFVNKSILDLISGLDIAGAQIKSTTDIFKIAFTAISTSIQNIAKDALSFLTFKNIVSTLTKTFDVLKFAIFQVSKAFLSLLANPLVLAITAIGAALYGLYNALVIIDEQTGIFTDAFNSLKQAFNSTKSIFEPVIEFFSDLGDALKTLVFKTLGFFVDKIALVLDGVIALAQGFSIISSAVAGENSGFNRSIATSRDKLDEFRKNLKDVGYDLRRLPKNTEINLNAKTKLDFTVDPKVLEDFKKFEKDINKLGLTQIQKVKETEAEQLATLNDFREKNVVSLSNYLKLEKKIKDNANKEANKLLQEELKKRNEKFSGFGNTLVSGLQQGGAGVAGVVSNFAGKLVDAIPILEGFGGLATSLLSFLAQGPDVVKAQIQAFIDNLPLIITAITDSIPVVIETLAANSGKIIVALSNAIPIVANRLATELITRAPDIALAFINGLIAESGRLIQSIADGVKNAISQAAGFGGGGVRGAVSGSLVGGALGGPLGAVAGIKKFKFAEGGVVPGGAPFTDRVPALLTPGEVVLNRQQVSEIQQERQAGQQNDRPLTVNLMIGEEQLANVILSLNRQGFRLA